MDGLNELGTVYGLEFKKPVGLDEGVQKVIKIEHIKQATQQSGDEAEDEVSEYELTRVSEEEQMPKSRFAQKAVDSDSDVPLDDERDAKPKQKVDIEVQHVDGGMTPIESPNQPSALTSNRVRLNSDETDAGADEAAFKPQYFGSSFNVCNTDDENSDEDCGYKYDPEGKKPELLLATLEKIDDEELPIQLKL